jgi:hypothetical protein
MQTLLQFIDQTGKHQQLPGNGTQKLRMSENESVLENEIAIHTIFSGCKTTREYRQFLIFHLISLKQFSMPFIVIEKMKTKSKD